MKLYAVRDKSTGKLVCNLTNPRRKFWEKKGNAESAVKKADSRYRSYRSSDTSIKKDLEVVTYELTEVSE